MVGRSQSGTAYDVDSGKHLFDKQHYGAACYPAGFAGGARLLVVSWCGAGGPNEHDEVQELDPATGRAKWTKKIPKAGRSNAPTPWTRWCCTPPTRTRSTGTSRP